MIGLAGRLRMGGGGIRLVGYKSTTVSPITIDGLTGGIASSPIDGDMVILVIARGSTSDVSSSVSDRDGYTPLAKLQSYDSFRMWFYVGYAFVSSGEPYSELFSGPFGGPAVAQVIVLRGVDPASPLFVTPVTATAQNSFRPNPPSIAGGADMYLYVGGGVGGSTVRDYTFSAPDLTPFFTIAGQGDVLSTEVNLLTGTGLSKVTTDPAAFLSEGSPTSSAWCAVSIGLNAK